MPHFINYSNQIKIINFNVVYVSFIEFILNGLTVIDQSEEWFYKKLILTLYINYLLSTIIYWTLYKNH